MYFSLKAVVAVIGLFCTVDAQFGTTDPGPGTAPPDVSGCVDFIFAFDTSCSITEVHQKNARDMMKAIVNQIVLSPTSNIGDGANDFRIGVVRFQHHVSLVLSLSQGIDATTINAAIDTVVQDPKERCHTHTWEALNLVRDEFTNSSSDNRLGVSKVLFLIYDGITYGDSGFKNKPKTIVAIDDTKAAGIEVYVFQQDYLQKTPGQDPNIELNDTQHDEDHRFQMASVTLSDVFTVMADQAYTQCFATEPHCEPEPPPECTGLSVQSFKDATKSWDDSAQVTTWNSSQIYRFSKINLGLKGGDLLADPPIIHVSFESESVPNRFIKADPSANTISLSRRPAVDDVDQPTFDEEASFIEHADKFRNKHVALESVAKPGWYIFEETGGDLVLRQLEDSAAFKDCASFLYTVLR